MLKISMIFSGTLLLSYLFTNAPVFATNDTSDEKQTTNQTKEALYLQGFKHYHSVCNHCHGPDGLGSSFAPSLVKTEINPDHFAKVVRDGVIGSNGSMGGYANNSNVMKNLDAIYAYINARHKGLLGRGRPQ